MSAESGDSSEAVSKESATGTSSPEQEANVAPTIASEGSTEISASPSESPDATKVKGGRTRKRGRKWIVKEDYIDIIRDPFWYTKPWILGL